MPLRLEPRLSDPSTAEWAARTAIGLLLALLLAALVIALAGYDAPAALAALWRGAFGSPRALAATVNKAVPIGLCAMGIALAYRARLWNIGAEGQLYFGAFAATGVGLAMPQGMPAALAIAAVLLAGAMAGAAWAALAALPRAYLGMNEILSTLMLTYVAILWVDYLVVGPWADPLTYSFPYSPPIAAAARLGQLVGGMHGGVLLLAAAALLLQAVDRGLRWGYELRVAGDAPGAALYGGISPVRTILTGLMLAGALAGLAGAIEVSASTGRLQAGLSPGYGFMAILVAWLAAGNPLGIVLAAVLYAGLQNGGFALQVAGIPPAITVVLQAVLLLAALAAVGLGRYRVKLFRRSGVAG
ncbi:MAG TPA: ABC transporter permease [Geminicoccaceae bacterium]|nr:ABC transporter permease [Geminicoccaceae bacterium]